MRQNESRLQDKIARAEREAKARAEREAREAEQVRKRQAQAKAKGSTYKPTESERSLMSRTGGLGRPADRHSGRCVAVSNIASAKRCRASYAGKAR